jgi:hypothetical protein
MKTSTVVVGGVVILAGVGAIYYFTRPKKQALPGKPASSNTGSNYDYSGIITGLGKDLGAISSLFSGNQNGANLPKDSSQQSGQGNSSGSGGSASGLGGALSGGAKGANSDNLNNDNTTDDNSYNGGIQFNSDGTYTGSVD